MRTKKWIIKQLCYFVGAITFSCCSLLVVSFGMHKHMLTIISSISVLVLITLFYWLTGYYLKLK